MINYKEKIRNAIACPQFGYEGYGEWGALRYDQRVLIKRLLDESDSADKYIFNLCENIRESESKLEASEKARKEAIECINKELEEIGKHQYAIGTRRLNKIKNILDIDKQIDKYAERINDDPRYDNLEPIEFREHINHVKEQMMKDIDKGE